MENEEQKPEEVIEEAVAETQEEVVAEVKPDDRPEKNWKAELERKNKALEQARAELEAERNKQVNRRDANDLSTWSEVELKAIANSNDPSALPFKDQANDILVDRRVKRVLEKERMDTKRATTEIELRSKYPEALDPSTEFAMRMDQVMYDLDLQKSPAGRLAAAKIVAAELNKGNSKESSKGREKERVADVKGQMVDGDRPKPPTKDKTQKDIEEAARKVNSKNLNESASAMDALLKNKGLSSDSFFKR